MEIEWAKAGANLIVHSGDISMFSSTLRKDLKKMREALGNDTQLPDTKGATAV